jgi:hypothetical protein
MRSFAPIRAAALAALLVPQGLAAASGDAECLGCHGGSAERLTLTSGATLSLSVDGAALQRSVHGGALSCTDCHADERVYPHTHARPLARRRDIVRAATAHCGDCHDAAAAAWARSAHGQAFLAGADDAPTCSDCHGAHAIEQAASQVLASPETCGRCHGDAERMARHGLSPRVVSTYLQDFHGMAATLQRKFGVAPGAHRAATCVDCHGAHEVSRHGDPASRVSGSNLVRTCNQCHPDANASFVTAWTTHSPPSWKSASLVGAVQLFYRLMIPFMVVGLLLQIALHLWRMVVKR